MITFDGQLFDMVYIQRQAAQELLSLPGETVKLYLYGLLHTACETDEIARDLGTSKEKVLEALEQLRRAGLLSEEGAVLKYNGKAAQSVNPEVYQNAELNATLQRLFGDRELSYSDYRIFYECIDVYGLTESVALMCAEDVINTNKAKNRVPMSYVRERARQWAREGINTISAASAKMAEGQWDGARNILKKLGISRAATEEELRLYEKWIAEWGFSQEAIEAALPETIKARYPTFGYLDKILEGLYESRLTGSAEIQAYLEGRGQQDGKLKAVLKALRAPRLTVSQELREMYAAWKEKGLSDSMILYGAQQAALRGDATLGQLDAILKGWLAKGYQDPIDVRRARQAKETEEAAVAKVLSKAGVSKPVTGGDVARYRKFRETLEMPEEVILFAAEQAYGRPAPVNAMDVMLTRWHSLGVRTVAQAKEADSAFRARATAQENPDERDYSNIQIYDPLSELEDEDD